MKLTEFIDEFTDPAIDKHFVKQYVDFISKNCGNAIKAYTRAYGVLYTGVYMQKYPYMANTLHSPEHREPRGMAEKRQKFIDKCLKLVGFKALRTNSMFAIGSAESSMEFGNPYIVFPFDTAFFTWSKKYNYLTNTTAADAGA